MALEIGSMLIKAKFDSGNITAGLAGMNSKLKESTLAGKSATTEFMRMKGALIGLAAAAGLSAGVLLGMLTNAVMQSPFLAAALEKLKNQFMLFGNAIAKHVAPILEKLVDLVKWLREKFEALPDPVQSIIVKGIILSGVILGLVGVMGTFILFISAVKTALIGLGLSGVAAKFGTLVTAISGSAAVALLFSIALGLVAGGLGVLALDELGVIKWFEDLGASIEFADRKLRDLLIALGTPAAVLGGGILDIVRGSSDWEMARQAKQQGEEAKWRYRQGVSEYYGEGERMHSEDLMKPKIVIENQHNEVHNDFSGLVGNMDDPADVQSALDRINAANVEMLQSLEI
jgi:hypothetical protein